MTRHLRSSRWRRIQNIAFSFVIGAMAACTASPSSSPAVTALESPVSVALAIFDAMNSGEMSLAASYWTPEDRGHFAQSVPPPNVFQNVTCRPGQRYDGELGDTDTDAGVSCEFDMREAWSGFEAGHWQWGVSLRRQAPGPWLIYSWGQG